MRIVSWNTNGLRATIKQENFIPLFAFNNPASTGASQGGSASSSQDGPDIVCFQETKCEPDQLDEKSRNLKGYHSYFSYSKGRKGYSGIAIYSKTEPEKIEYGFGIPKFDDEGRTLVAYYKDFVLISCYFPNGGGGEERLNYKLEFYDAFLEFINKLKKSGHHVIFCGDINTAHEEIDLARPKENEDSTGFLPVERAWMDELVNNGWVDIFRHFYPNKKDVYTYWDMKTRARDRNVGWRLDYFFANQSFVSKIKSFKTMSDYYGSDHCPIMIEF